MGLWAKFAQFAPIIVATGAAFGLFVIKLDDPKTKRAIRAISLFLAIGTAFSVMAQLPTVLPAVEESYKFGLRMFGVDDESRLERIRRDAEIEAARLKAEADARAAKARADAERIKIEVEAQAARDRAEADRIANLRRIEEETRAREAAAQRAREAEETARRAAAQRAREAALIAEQEEQARRAREQQARQRLVDIVRQDRCKALTVCPPGEYFSLGEAACIPTNGIPPFRC